MSESDLERELHRRGQALMRKLLQGHLDQRSPGEAAGPVAGADGVERSERRVHQRHIETTFGTVEVERLGYARAGHDSLHPLDAALNLPPERYLLPSARNRQKLDSGRPQDVVVAGGIVNPTACACAHRRQGASLRSAPAPRADGLDAGSAHARPDWLLPTMLTHTPPTCCGRRPVQNDALSGDR